MIPKHGLKRDDDLRALIRETLQRRNIQPTKQVVEDIYTLLIKVAANMQYKELRRIILNRYDQDQP